jgi:cyclohexyl-isocyanide hydratase
MNVGFVVYDGMTALDFVGAFDPVTRLATMNFREDVTWNVCARQETVTATGNLRFEADRVDPSLDDYDLCVVPGGFVTRDLANDEGFVDWIRTAEDCAWKASVCTGSLLLGAAGFLDGRRATTHPMAFEDLAAYCEVVDERVVEDGDTITARGVTSALDLGLYLVETFEGKETHEEIRTQMDYSDRPAGDF